MPYAAYVRRHLGPSRVLAVACLVLGVACAFGPDAEDGEAPPLVGATDACSGRSCKRVECGARPRTRLTGRVTDPAGLRGIYNVAVYVPNGPLEPVPRSGGSAGSS